MKTLLEELEEIDNMLTQDDATPEHEKRGQQIVALADAAPMLFQALQDIYDFQIFDKDTGLALANRLGFDLKQLGAWQQLENAVRANAAAAIARATPEAHMHKHHTISSSHGDLTANAEGIVIARDLDNEDADGGGHLAQITRFDLEEEWRRHWKQPLPADLDILDAAYWYTDPTTGREVYAPPDADWRTDIAKAAGGTS